MTSCDAVAASHDHSDTGKHCSNKGDATTKLYSKSYKHTLATTDKRNLYYVKKLCRLGVSGRARTCELEGGSALGAQE